MRYLILLLSVTFLITGCAKIATDEEVVAVVNKEKITMAMLNERIDELPEYYRSAAMQHKREILDDLIVEKLLFDEAKKKKLHKDEEVRELIDKAKRKILIAKLLESETSLKKLISDEDIELYYKQQKEQYLIPEKVKASHILLSTKEEATKVLEKLNAGADFDEMAKLHSKDLTRDRGGDLGYFQRGQMIPEFENACFDLQPGGTSGIVETRFGYHIIKVTDRRASEYRPLSEVKENIRAKLIDQARQQQFRDFVQLLKDRSKIEIFAKGEFQPEADQPQVGASGEKEEFFKEESTEESTSAKEPTQ